jgi:autotransporter family porin
MNRFYRVIWNATLGCFNVVSELAQGKKKSNSLSVGTSLVDAVFSKKVLLTCILSAIAMEKSHATDQEVGLFTPQDASYSMFTSPVNLITGLSNGFANIASGNIGYSNYTLQQAKDENRIVSGEGYLAYDILHLGVKSATASYSDPVTGTKKSLPVYDSSAMVAVPASEFVTALNYAVGVNGQYVDKKLMSVQSGGVLDVNVGTSGAGWVNNPANKVNVIMKGSQPGVTTSAVFDVTGTGVLNYNSKTVASLGNSKSYNKQRVATFKGGFNGTFQSAVGMFTVNNLDDFKSYNDALVDAIESGALAAEQYDIEIAKGYQQDSKQVVLAPANTDPNDAVNVPIDRDRVAFIRADGADAKVNMGADANIELYFSDATGVRLSNGATLTNLGTLGTVNSTLDGAYVISAKDSIINNLGVIDVGTNPDMAEYVSYGVVIPNPGNGAQFGILANGASSVTNDGVINLAPRQDWAGTKGVVLDNTSTLVNNGAINVAAAQQPLQINGPYSAIGVTVQRNSSFENNGDVYIGRLAQRSSSESTADVSVTSPGTLGVTLENGGTFNNNASGKITIGSLVQGATAVIAKGVNSVVNQKGIINVNGRSAVNKSAQQNIALDVTQGANKVNNSGTINLNGINSIGIRAQAASSAANSGTIKVNTGVDRASGTANYGIWSEGAGASVTHTGTVELKGDRAIGIHARNGGIVTQSDNGSVSFDSGENQVGYYIYGAGSAIINNTSGEQNVSTKGSTLYRIDGGATFVGNTENTSVMKASGENSTILLVTGKSEVGTSSSSLNTGKMALNVDAKGATAVKVEGGAKGVLDQGVVLSLTAEDATAGIVDGKSTSILGDAGITGASQLTSYAKLDGSNTANGAMGYIARNSGTLIHKGSLNFVADNSTGVLVDGGRLENSSDIAVNGVAVDIIGGSSSVTNTGSVKATGGIAAYRLQDGASLSLNGQGTTIAQNGAHGVLIEAPSDASLIKDGAASQFTVTDATISVEGSGNAIENGAEIGGIRMVNTTLNVEDGAGLRTGTALGLSNSGTITVSGKGKGIGLANADGSETTADLNLLDSDGLTINVTGKDGNGIVTNTHGDVKNGTTINVTAADGGAALAVGGTTANVVQSGTLTSRSTTTEVVSVNNGRVGTFTNGGTIQAKSADQVAVASSSGAGMTFTNAAGANIVGKVNLLSGDNTVNLSGGSTATDFYTGNGKDVFNLKGIKADETALFTSLNGGAGDDTLILDNSAYVLNKTSALTGFETISLTNKSTFTEENVLLALGDDGGDASGTKFNIGADSTLALNNTSDVAFKSHLAGAGTVKADLAGKAFNFTDNNRADTFAGTLDLANSTFALEGINTEALKSARLKVSEGSVATVGEGQQKIGGLAFNGGTVDFGVMTPGIKEASNTVQTANSLDISGRGAVQVALDGVFNDQPLPADRLTLMEQDDANLLVKLADSTGTVTGTGGGLELKDRDGNVITSAIDEDLLQNGEAVAKGTWDYRLTSGDQADGLYINYGLKQVELLALGDNALVLNGANKTGTAGDLSAKVTGLGDLRIDTPAGTVSLSNLNNDYLGKTTVASGTLALANDNVLGKTGNLQIESGAGVETRGYSQKVGALNTAQGSQLNLAQGSELTITDAQRSAGDLNGGTIHADTLAGSGKLIIDPSVVTVNGANGSYTGDVTLTGGSQAELNHASGLGDTGLVTLSDKEDRLTFAKQLATDAAAIGNLGKQLAGAGAVELKDSADITLIADNGAFNGEFSVDSGSYLRASGPENLGEATIANNGDLHLSANQSWELTNAVTGGGSLDKLGGATLVVNRDLAYTGETNLHAGRLVLGDNASAGGKLSGNGAVNIAAGTSFGGNGVATGAVNNQGTLAALNAMAGYESEAAVTLTVGSLTNAGDIKLAGASAGNTLVVNGNYAGDNGLLALNTALSDDGSLTDKLIVKGDTSGSTRVRVNNLGGSGALTSKGIEVVQVGGESGGNFTLEGRAVAGAYDYFLNKGQAQDGNWYLQSQLPTPVDPVNPVNPVDPVDPVDPVKPTDPIVRPEAGAYTANIAAANTMFVTTLHDRLGETNYVDMLTGEEKVTSMWMRNIGGHTGFRDGSGQLKTQSNRYVLQLGGDMAQWSTDGADRTHVGIMAGYGNNQSNTRSSATKYSADGSVNGYSVGAYGTWLANEAGHTGAYVDSWVQYNWFNNGVKGKELSSESYKSDGFTASLETGYTFKTGEFKGSKGSTNAVYVQPQAQAVWMGVKADSHTEANGTRVGSEGDGNLMTRLGVRTYLKGHSKLDDGKDREFQPFVEANWIHNTKNFGAQMNDVSSSMDGTKNIAELKVGVEGQLNKNLNLWGNVTSQVGDKGYSDNAAMIGVKYNFK